MSDNNGGLVKSSQSFSAPAHSPAAYGAVQGASPGGIIDAEYTDVRSTPRFRGVTKYLALGIKSFFWTLRNPTKSFWLTMGWLSGLTLLGFFVGFGLHLLVGQPGQVKLARPIDPVGWGAMGAEVIRTPFYNSARYTNQYLRTAPQTMQAPAVVPQGQPDSVLDLDKNQQQPQYRR